MVTKQATVRNEHGIHCRPSAVIAKEAQNFPADITVSTPSGNQADAKNILSMIGLGATCGQELSITVSGPDEEECASRMVELLETRFDFPPRQE